MNVVKTEIDGVLKVELDSHGDDRGIFVETFRRSWFPGQREMIQSNRADRKAGSIVGLHYHLHQADYWYVPFGKARAVMHDLRDNSPTQGKTIFIDMGQESGPEAKHIGVYIPPGVAHGFAAITDMTITYLVDGYYNPADELGVLWNDPEIKADWGIVKPVVSERDQKNPAIKDIPRYLKPHFGLRT